MDEILELQQQLAAAQLGSAAQKLSERNCVELVMKLQSLKLVDLIFTRSGKEYLTHKQLIIEIEDELLARGGRVNVIDLPDALNVELFHIQSKIPQIIAASDDSTRLVRGELLTDYYLASVAEEINDNLTASEHGIDDIGSIASRYALPVDVVRRTVTMHLGSLIDATLDPQNPDVIRSAASIARDRAAARGLLRAITVPTVLADLANSRGLGLPLVTEMADAMLQTGELSGSVTGRGPRAIFVPHVFAKAAVHAASSAFASNGFIAINRLDKMHIPDTNAFIAEYLPNAITLDNCIVGPSLIDTLVTSTAEAISGGSWLDIEGALPPDFPEGDVGSVLARLHQSLQHEKDPENSKTTSGTTKSGKTRRRAKSAANGVKKPDRVTEAQVVYSDRFIVSPTLRKRMLERLMTDARLKADDRARLMSEKMSTVVTTSTSEEQGDALPLETGKKTKGKGRRRAGGKEKSNKSTSGFNDANGTNDPPISIPTMEEAVEIVLSEEELSRAVESDYLGSSIAGDEMLSCVMEDMYTDVQSEYATIAEEALASLVRERAVAKLNREKALLAGLEEAELHGKAAASLPEDELANASRLWVMDEICMNALCRIVDSVAQGTGIVEAAVVKAHELPGKREKLDVIRGVLPKLAPPLETKLRAFVSTVNDKEGGRIETFLTLYDENTELLDLPARRPLDRKAEKAAFANVRARLKHSLQDEGMGDLKRLEIATKLVHASSFGGVVLVFSPDATMGFCKAVVERSRSTSLGSALEALGEAVEKSEGSTGDSGNEEELAEEVRNKLTVVMEEIKLSGS